MGGKPLCSVYEADLYRSLIREVVFQLGKEVILATICTRLHYIGVYRYYKNPKSLKPFYGMAKALIETTV